MNKIDLDQVCEIESEVYKSSSWSYKTFLNEISSGFTTYLCFEDNSKSICKILGYAGYWKVLNEGHIVTMVVHPLYRRKHIADILIYNLIQDAIQNMISWLTLEVRISNLPAINCYKKYGFKPIGIRKKYYQDNLEDALIMWSEKIEKADNLTKIIDIYLDTKQRLGDADIFKYTNLS